MESGNKPKDLHIYTYHFDFLMLEFSCFNNKLSWLSETTLGWTWRVGKLHALTVRVNSVWQHTLNFVSKVSGASIALEQRFKSHRHQMFFPLWCIIVSIHSFSLILWSEQQSYNLLWTRNKVSKTIKKFVHSLKGLTNK